MEAYPKSICLAWHVVPLELMEEKFGNRVLLCFVLDYRIRFRSNVVAHQEDAIAVGWTEEEVESASDFDTVSMSRQTAMKHQRD
jgi:hypothetical protein